MLKSLLLTALAVALVAGVGYADQSKGKVVIAVRNTVPTNGKQMFVSYCAPCHGVDGRGHGPVASALKQQPPDLTILARNNGGKFPGSHIASVLDYGTEMPVHGTAQMPVWGPVLGKMDRSFPQERLLRISNLSQFLRTIQTR